MSATDPRKEPAIPRDAASLVLLREAPDGVRVLMGQRGSGAKFMPSRMVFPGGSVDKADRGLDGDFGLHTACHERLTIDADRAIGPALARAALRETLEEAGIRLGAPTSPLDADGLRFFFRAITPPSRPIRFDARFFLGNAKAIHGDHSDFSGADGELSRLDWYPLTEARDLPLAFITHIVLAETAAAVEAAGGIDGLFHGSWTRPVPYFRNDEEEGAIVRQL